MTKSAGKRRGFAGFDPQSCVDFLRKRHPKKTALCVEAETGVPARTIERWLALDVAPSLDGFLCCVVAYGPAFLAASIPGLAWVEAAAAFATFEGMNRQIAHWEARRDAIAADLGLTREPRV